MAKILVVPYGQWQGHPMGEQTYTEAEGQQIVDYFNMCRDRAEDFSLQVDYEHQSLNQNLAGMIPAAGWINELIPEPDGIYADVDWTDEAGDAIKAKKVRYLSPVIVTNDIDPVTGEIVPIQLWNAAVTNQPFMADKMKALAASAVKSKDGHVFFPNSKTLINKTGAAMDIAEKFKEAAAVFGLTGDNPDEFVSLIQQAAKLLSAMPGAPSEGLPSGEQMEEMQAAMSKVVTHSKSLADVATYLECKPDEVLTRVTSMSNKTDDATKLRTELDKIKAEFTAVQIDKLVNDTYANKIPPAKREFWTNYAKAHGLDATESVLKEQEYVLPADPVKPDNKAIEDKDVPEAYIAHALKMNHGMSRDRAIEHYKKLHSHKMEA